jgi:DNA-binding CsgD family transcriptional regulator
MNGSVREFQKIQKLPLNVAVLDSTGMIVSVNRAWRDFGRRNGLRIPRSGVGLSYFDYCPSDSRRSLRFINDLRRLLAGELDLLTLVYPCHSPTKKRWFLLSGVPLSLGNPSGAGLLHTNLTDVLALSPAAGKAASIALKPRVTMDVLGASVEHSVSENLSSQLTMLSSDRSAPDSKAGTARREAERIIARARLSRRQREILDLLARGRTNAEIAYILRRSPHTIKLHVSAILKQLNYKNRTQAALLAFQLMERNSDPAA